MHLQMVCDLILMMNYSPVYRLWPREQKWKDNFFHYCIPRQKINNCIYPSTNSLKISGVLLRVYFCPDHKIFCRIILLVNIPVQKNCLHSCESIDNLSHNPYSSSIS